MPLKLLLSDEKRASYQTYTDSAADAKKKKKKEKRLFNLIRTCKTLCMRMGIKVRTSFSNPIKTAIKVKLTRRV